MGELVEMEPEANGSYGSHKWWKEAVVYQVYPASFLSSGSGSIPGWGDIRGITSKVNYFKDLGIDVLWLSPIYKSPQVDMGYDVADYYEIDPRYGTVSDVDELIEVLKSRGMRLMMDVVANHTSDQHDWFLDSRSSKTAKKRDWYIWQPAKYDESGNRQPPNNWASILGGTISAWTWDEHTEEYYLSLFTPSQPDLNWRNEDVRDAIHKMLRFWLDKGVAGFRLDVINHISKVKGYPDAPITNPDSKYQPGDVHFANGPHLHEYLQEMRKKVLADYDTITVGEMPSVHDGHEILKVVGAERGEINMIFIFDIMDMDTAGPSLSIGKWTVSDLREIMSRWQKVMYEGDGWNTLFLENHDNPRSVTRFGDDSKRFRELSAKLLCLMLTTLGGTVYMFQGEELGMKNVPPDWPIEEYKDVGSKSFWKKVNEEHPGDEKALEQAKEVLQHAARDNGRTPVQWNNTANAGFCPADVTPWMRVNDDYETWNAKAQLSHTGSKPSVLQFWRLALSRRKNFKDVFVYGNFECLEMESDTVFAYKRTSEENESWLTVLNFSDKKTEWKMPGELGLHGFIESNYGDATEVDNLKDGSVKLRAWEGLLARLVNR